MSRSDTVFFHHTGVVRKLNALRFSMSYDLGNEWKMWFSGNNLHGLNVLVTLIYLVVVVTFDAFSPLAANPWLSVLFVAGWAALCYGFANYLFFGLTEYLDIWEDVLYREFGRFEYDEVKDYENLIQVLLEFLRYRLIRGSVVPVGENRLFVYSWSSGGEEFKIFYDVKEDDFVVQSASLLVLPSIEELEREWDALIEEELDDDYTDEDWDDWFADDD